MKAPLSWLDEFVPGLAAHGPEDIAEKFVSLGFEVEDVIELKNSIKGPIVIGQVLSIEELTEHKKPIRYVGLDCGEKQTRYVICGARNFQIGDRVVVALPGSTLPGNFEIVERMTYGRNSNGMICSARELGLGDDHSGIITLSPEAAEIGEDARNPLGLKDVIFDISINPDRGYAMSIRGLAREVSNAYDMKFIDPADNYVEGNWEREPTDSVKAKITDGASVMFVRTFHGFDSKLTSPWWMKSRLQKSGMRSISLPVDITNYVMLELGQPLHAFDADSVDGFLEIRRVGKEIPFTTLDGVNRLLNADDLVVADSSKILALAGTMGGLESEVTNSTKNIAIEAVAFDPPSISRNSRGHHLSTEASRRFERGVDPNMAEIASARAGSLLMELGNAQYVGTHTDGDLPTQRSLTVSYSYFAQRLGYPLTNSEIKNPLIKIGCGVTESKDGLTVHVPSWRPDLTIPADLSEELARVNGYQRIPSLPAPRKNQAVLSWAQKRNRVLGQTLVAQGYVEVLNFPFVSSEIITELGFTGERANMYRLANPMAEDKPYLRPHLLPGLLDAATRNIGRGFRDFAIYEEGLIFRKKVELEKSIKPELGRKPSEDQIRAMTESVPNQIDFISGLLVGRKNGDNWRKDEPEFQWFDAISQVENILNLLNLPFTKSRSNLAPWHPGRCVEFCINGVPVSHAGELHPRVVAQYGLGCASAWAINLDLLPQTAIVSPEPITTMPAAVQDVAVVVDEAVPASQVESALRSGAGKYLESINLFDRYPNIAPGKVSLAFTLVFRSSEKTFTNEEVAHFRADALQAAQEQCGAIPRV